MIKRETIDDMKNGDLDMFNRTEKMDMHGFHLAIVYFFRSLPLQLLEST